jgi:hypothetical protein
MLLHCTRLVNDIRSRGQPSDLLKQDWREPADSRSAGGRCFASGRSCVLSISLHTAINDNDMTYRSMQFIGISEQQQIVPQGLLQ